MRCSGWTAIMQHRLTFIPGHREHLWCLRLGGLMPKYSKWDPNKVPYGQWDPGDLQQGR